MHTLCNQLKVMEVALYLVSPISLESVTMQEISGNPPSDEVDDEPIYNTTLIDQASLTPNPYKFKPTLPTNSPASYGLLLASRQAEWMTPILDAYIPNTSQRISAATSSDKYPQSLEPPLLRNHPGTNAPSTASPLHEAPIPTASDICEPPHSTRSIAYLPLETTASPRITRR